jgi:tetratricopeptide (TPR) repeat protein
MAFWPALVLSTARRTPAVLQVALLAVAVFLLDFSFLPESRASLVVVLVVPIVVAFAPERGRLLARIGVVVLAAAVAIGPAYDVYSAARGHRPLAPVVHSAAEAMLPSVAIAVFGALVLVLVERRITLTPRSLRRVRVGALALLAAALLAGAGVAIAHDGAISHYASERWSAFRSDAGVADDRKLRIAQQSSDKRYDYWRVSLDMFSAAPILGAGAGNFEREYTVHRRHAKTSRSAHSIWLRTLGELGSVGMALLVACAGVALVALVRLRRRLDTGARTVLTACVGVNAYFVAHASFDWLELLPALAAPALALPFMALRLQPGTTAAATAVRPLAGRRARLLVAVGAGLVVAAALVSLALPYLSSRYVQSALHRARSDPAGARRDLDRAASLDPLSPDPRYAAAGIALDRSRFGDARRAFEQALGVEDGWYPHFGLALLDSRARRFAAARREIARARALDAQDPLVIRAAMLIGERKRLDPRAVDRKTLALPLYKDLRHQ